MESLNCAKGLLCKRDTQADLKCSCREINKHTDIMFVQHSSYSSDTEFTGGCFPSVPPGSSSQVNAVVFTDTWTNILSDDKHRED